MVNPLILVLGAGINGTAVARELVLNHLDVILVDIDDVAGGTSAKSSRLIHGGLRYLEYGEFSLVRESLAERNRLLRLAPQFVQPLQLFIPARKRFGGLMRSAWRFLGLESWAARLGIAGGKERGLVLVQAGLTMYDLYARDASVPRHRTVSLSDAEVPRFDPKNYRFACSYWDAQILYPERFQLAMLEDARQQAEANGTRFEVHPYTKARRIDRTIELRSEHPERIDRIEPSVIINATGAWGDRTLKALELDTKPLFAGTKGSHFITFHDGLRATLGRHAVYAEARDGRLVFLLPLGGAVMVGTTDEPFAGDPHEAIASEAELDYLRGLVRELFPDVRLERSDMTLHYCGVRPLPYVSASNPSAVTRRHWIEPCDAGPIPVLTLVGGKLTVCRSLAEDTARQVLERLGRTQTADSRDRLIPGAKDFPTNDAERARLWERFATESGADPETIRELWPLYGTRVAQVLRAAEACQFGTNQTFGPASGEWLDGTRIPLAAVRWMIRHEWVRRLADLVERRLLLVYRQSLSRAALEQLADLLVAEGLLDSTRRNEAIEAEIERLHQMLGRRVDELDGPQ